MSERIEASSGPESSWPEIPTLKTEDLRRAIAFLNEGRADYDVATTKYVKLNRGARSVGLASVNTRVGLGSRLNRKPLADRPGDSKVSDPFCCRLSNFVA